LRALYVRGKGESRYYFVVDITCIIEYQDIAFFLWLFYIVAIKQEHLLINCFFLAAFYEFN